MDTMSTGELMREDEEKPQEHREHNQLVRVATETNVSFTLMVLEKTDIEEEDELKHCPVYVREVFQEYPSLLKEEEYDKPRKHGVVFSLNIDLEKRIYNRPRPLTHDRREIKEEVLAMEKKGILQRALSIHNSPIVAVRKKNGKIRICNDFRKLNELILDPIVTLPPLKYVCRNFYGSKIFSCLDLCSAFMPYRSGWKTDTLRLSTWRV